MPGIGELLIILAIVLVIFGASKLPKLGDALGRSIGNFKRAVRPSDELEVSDHKQLGP
jgi:sec-independent protein translocase protein TatA